MNKKDIINALGNIDPKLIDDAENASNKKSIFFKYAAIAACICVFVTAAVLFAFTLNSPNPSDPTVPTPDSSSLQVPQQSESENLPFDTIIIDSTVSPQNPGGASLEIVVGSSSSSGPSGAPPSFGFDANDIVVKAVAVNILPDISCKLDVSSEYKPTQYRLVQMQTVEVLNGVGVPESFIYLLPEHYYADLTKYDSLFISMVQEGVDNYIMKNMTKNQLEAFQLYVFEDSVSCPVLGNIIAFTDGIFDESLWQTESWLYGYQFASFILDYGGIGLEYLVVDRGCDEEYTVRKINDFIGNSDSPMSVYIPDTSNPDIEKILEYVKPFENGVFSNTVDYWRNRLIFRRFISGCQTDEIIYIDIKTGEISYSDSRYTVEELTKIPDISAHISILADEYRNNIPTPPHTDTDGKKLYSLHLFGWYVKSDEKVYGVIKTVWKYRREDSWQYDYYDDSYILFDCEDGTVRNISRDELTEIVGTNNVYQGEYGIEIELPQ